MSRAEVEALVKQDLAKRLKVSAELLEVVNAADRTWPDPNLGCGARKGFVEPQPVPGFAFTLAYAGRRYLYHSDRRGQFRRCPAATRLGRTSG